MRLSSSADSGPEAAPSGRETAVPAGTALETRASNSNMRCPPLEQQTLRVAGDDQIFASRYDTDHDSARVVRDHRRVGRVPGRVEGNSQEGEVGADPLANG